MSKRLLVSIIAIVVVVILVTTSLGIYTTQRNYKLTDNVWARIGTVKKVARNTDTSVDDLTVYNYEDFIMSLRYRYDINPNMSSETYFLQHYNKSFPIEKMKLIDENTLAVVYKLSDNDGEQALLSLIFEREIEYFSKGDGVDASGKYECWTKTGEFYFVTEQLSFDDLKNVKIGDSFDEVKKLDAAVSFDRSYMLYKLDTKPKAMFTSYRMLSDGIAVIEFEGTFDENHSPDDISGFSVSSIDFYSYDEDMPEYVTLKDDKLFKWIFK